MKVKETRTILTRGRNATRVIQDRVIELETTDVPAGAVVVDDSTTLHDWQTAVDPGKTFGGN